MLKRFYAIKKLMELQRFVAEQKQTSNNPAYEQISAKIAQMIEEIYNESEKD